jgi:hypothetical protein
MTDGAAYGIEIVDSGSARGTWEMPDDVVCFPAAWPNAKHTT